MSLKAKIEAVIYASEEPVTLAQLAGLLGQEAEAELAAEAARQQPLALQELAGEASAEASAAAADPVSGETTQEPPPEEAEDELTLKRQARDRDRRVREYLRGLVDELVRDYATGDRGCEVREVAGGYRMGTKPEYHDAVRGFVKRLKPPMKLSLQALETLAVVAYKQPVTAPEIAEIRGVDSGGVLGSLLGRKLVATAGRKQVIGRPILYRTTREFLLRFGLNDLGELPSIEEFEKMAGELAAQEEIEMSDAPESVEAGAAGPLDGPGPQAGADPAPQANGDPEPQADGDSESLDTPLPDDSNRPDDDLPAIDGRLSGLPPSDNVPGEDPSADEAAIQNERKSEES